MGVCMYECCTVRYLADISPWPPLALTTLLFCNIFLHTKTVLALLTNILDTSVVLYIMCT